MPNRTDKLRAAIVAALALSTLAAYALYRVGPGFTRQAQAEPNRGSTRYVAAAPLKPGAKPKPVSASTNQVTLSAQLDRSAVLVGSDGLVHVALTLRADSAAQPGAAQKPTDALVVLDLSGSMSGQKLTYAKQALHQLIDRLTPRDRFGLVTYESDAQLALPLSMADGVGRTRFHDIVEGLQTAGGTNMSAGLDLALEELGKRQRGGRDARVLLLSDGHANMGDSSAAGLSERARQITRSDDVLSAMGIGDDFNEDLMTGLADSGTGNFYYLSRVEMLGSYFDAELKAAAQTLASAVELRFAPADGVELLELSGYPIERAGGTLSVRPGNLRTGQERVLWATLRAPTAALRDVALGSFSLQFKQDEVAFEVNAAPLPALACVADTAQFEAGIARPLWEQYTLNEQYRKVESAMGRAIAEGNAQDIEREQAGYEANRMLASKLGSAQVLNSMDTMARVAGRAKEWQQAAPAQRAFQAKQEKSRAHFNRRAGAYNSDPMLAL
jgi:Ca-activated chloride channel family protein